VQLHVARFVNTMNVSEAGSNRKVRANFGESGPDVVDIFGLCVKRVVVNIFVVDTILFTTSDANFLAMISIFVSRPKDISHHLKPLLHWSSTFQILLRSLDIPVYWLF
jgi:hypothetical protein